ncbi:outer membrane protein assembly factor BamE [Aristophania vespae]|uniref:outer membrane protein assembly factor BamE n=1 Tax=Aristophania vespae TaxID=2697033 RepID=UPI0023518251|nr:outer membrane protein assembly factor BamE [Aristophania vespae]
MTSESPVVILQKQDSNSCQTHHAKRMKRSRSALLLTAMLLTSGCAVFEPPPIPRGSLVEKYEYKKLIPGTTTRDDVENLIGSPTVRGTFNDNAWYYVSLTKNLVPLGFPATDKQSVLVLNFDQSGILRDMHVLKRKDSIQVAMVSDETPTPGTEVSVIQELLGNVGKYNPMNAMGSAFGMGGAGSAANNMGGLGAGTGNGGVGNSLN